MEVPVRCFNGGLDGGYSRSIEWLTIEIAIYVFIKGMLVKDSPAQSLDLQKAPSS